MNGIGEVQKIILIYLDTMQEPVSVNKMAFDLHLENQPHLINLSLAQFLRVGLIAIELQNGENVICKRTADLVRGDKEKLLSFS